MSEGKGGNKGRLPSVTSDIPKDLRYFLDRVGEMLTTAGVDRFVTVRDLTGLNVIGTDADGNPEPVDDQDNTVDIDVLKPPPFTATVSDGYEYIYVDWSGAGAGQEPGGYYYGHALTEIWAGTTDNLQDAVLVQTISGTAKVTSIYFGTGVSNLRIWGRFQNILGVYGDFGGPYLASTAIDVPYVLDALENQISLTELANDVYTLDATATDGYVVKLNNGGVAAGFGLAVESNGQGDTYSQFAVLADNFAILAPVDFNQANQPGGTNGDLWRRTTDGRYFIKEGGTWVPYDGVPFTVQTTPTTVTYTDPDGNVQEVDVPPGVYIRSAFIQDGTITNAMIQTASIDTARIADAAITNAKVGFLDAGKITSGILQSDGFNNSPGFAGWFFNKGVNADGNQEDVQVIIRSSEYDTPALELFNGNFTINGLSIREFIQSSSWPARGFQFDIDEDTYQFRDSQGRPIFTLDGSLDKAAIERSISDRIATLDTRVTTFYQTTAPTASAVGDLWVDTNDDNKLYRWNGSAWLLARDSGIAQALNDAAQAASDASDAQDTADNKITTYFQTSPPSVFTPGLSIGDLWFDTNDNNKMYRWTGLSWVDTSDQRIETVVTDNGELNQKLDQVLSPDGAGGFEINPSKVVVNYIDNAEVSLADYRFLQAFANETQLDAFFDKAAFGDLIAGTLVARNAIVDTGTFDTVLSNTVAANNGNIQNLQVGTLEIDGEAVVVPRFDAGSISTTTFTTSSRTLCQQFIQLTGLKGSDATRLLVMAHCTFYPTNSTAAGIAMDVQVRQTGTSTWVNNRTVAQTIRDDGNTFSVTSSFRVGSNWSGDVRTVLRTGTPGASSKTGSAFGGLVIMAAKKSD